MGRHKQGYRGILTKGSDPSYPKFGLRTTQEAQTGLGTPIRSSVCCSDVGLAGEAGIQGPGPLGQVGNWKPLNPKP